MNEITSKGFCFNLNIEQIIPSKVKVFSLFSCLLIFVIELASAAAPIPVIKDLVNVQIQDRAELNRLRQLASDLDEHYADLLQGFVTIYASDAEQAMLKASGFNFQVVIENLSDFYAQRAIRERQSRQAVTTNSMGGFRTLVEIERTLEQLTKTFPNIVSNKFSIGKSYEGREIWAIRLSDHPNVYEPTEPTVWFDALHHAREAMSGESLLLFADWLVNHYGTDPTVTRLIDSRNILLIPCVNPDGYEYNRQQHPNGGGLWRKNRRDNGNNSYGVDLNRNYGWEWRADSNDPNGEDYQGVAPFSEPETAAIRDLLAQQTPSLSVSVHSYGNEWMYPWGYTALPTPDDEIFRGYAAKIVATNGYTTETAWNLYGMTRGASDDYHYGTYNSLAFTVEIGNFEDGFWPSPARIEALFKAVQPGYRMIAQWAGAYADVLSPLWTELQGNGDKWFDAGEIWSLRLPIKNEGVLPLNAEVLVSSRTPAITIEGGRVTVSVAPRQETLTQPIKLHFTEMIDSETPYVLDVAINYEGVVSSEPLKIGLGQPRILLFDEMETADFGWTMGLAAQTSVGKAVPVSEGALCWTATAASETIEETTWLTSPLFRAEGLQHLELEYRRVHLGGAPVLVQVSNDNGVSWATLEEVENLEQWTTVRFDLEDYLALSEQMRVRLRTKDELNGNVTSACIDDFRLRTHSHLPTLAVWGELVPGGWVRIFLDGAAQVAAEVFWSLETSTAQSFPNIEGAVYLAGNIQPLFKGMTNKNGQISWLLQLPEQLSRQTVYLQALLDHDGKPYVSRLAKVRFE